METLVKEKITGMKKIKTNVFDNPTLPVSGTCMHNGSSYSDGATVTMEDGIYRCSGGSWVWHSAK
jgi:hypothetical protein